MKRNDIQGLRALAVGLVIADHVIGHPSGGFLGVDVFFVLSGFLITGLLVRERAKTGRISFSAFYARRARRILPAAALVLLVTVAAAWLVFRSERALSATIDAAGSLLFVENWRLAVLGTDYMNAGASVSPLQHFWSLSVEEQFYIGWPWLIILAFALGARFAAPRARTIVLAALVGLAVVASLVWAFHETETARTVAYFSTFSRAWELGAGALAAIAAPQLSRIPDALRPVLAWLGLGVLAASVVVVDRTSAFPAPWALPAVVGTVMVIAAGTGGTQRWLWPLTNPVARYLGDISYSLYLWHFPVIIIGATLFPATGRAWTVGVLVLTLLLSVLSYHLVENPIRNFRRSTPAVGRRPATFARLRRAGQVVGLAALIALLGVSAVSTATSLSARASAPTPATPPLSSEQLTERIELGSTATAWPTTRPSIDDLPDTLAEEWVKDGCLNVDDANVDRCSYGPADAPHVAVLLGDSVGISWMPALRAGLVPEGWRVQSLTLGECPAVDISVTRFTKDDFTQRCDAHHRWVLGQIEKIQPDLVILASAGSTLLRLGDGALGDAAVSEWGSATLTTLTAVRAVTPAPVAVLASPPTISSPQACATRVNKPTDCASTPESTYDGMVAAERSAVAEVSGTSEIVTMDWFCTPQRVCPPLAGETPTYSDSTHITSSWSQSLGGVLADELLRLTH